MAKSIMIKAKAFCESNKYRLSKPREYVLKIITESRKPIGAYEILAKLGRTINNPKPPTVYRAIEFWQSHNFIHRIESLNAYVACDADHLHRGSQFMICDHCGDVNEAHLCELPQQLKEKTIKSTFEPRRWNLEIHGVCIKCA